MLSVLSYFYRRKGFRQCGRTTQDSASVHRRKADNTGAADDLPSERLFLALHAKGIRIPAEISLTVDSFLLRGDRRTYLRKGRGVLYRKSKNLILKPFHLPTIAREDSRANLLNEDIFEDEQGCKNVHCRSQFLEVSAQCVKQNICNHSDEDAV